MKMASDQTSPAAGESAVDAPLRLQKILVPIDFSAESDRALEFAVPLARQFGATVHVVHVYDETRLRYSLATSPALLTEPEISGRLTERVQRQSESRLPRDTCHVRSGKPHREIIATAQELDAGLIVIATHGHGGIKHLLLGSTTEKVIRHAPCPVLVVRQATRGPIRTAEQGIVLEKILVPVDFSACAKEGARYASAFATRVGADLIFMHAVQPPDYMMADGMLVGQTFPPLLETQCLEAEDKLDQLVNFLPLSGISAETEVEVGEAVEKIVEISARPEVDMIITATHGNSGMRHALLGSVTEEVVRRARCPVLVVPSRRERRTT